MASIYTPDPTNSAQPLDTDYAYLQAAELRTLKGYLQTQLALLGGPIDSAISNENLLINGGFDFTRYQAFGFIGSLDMTGAGAGYSIFDKWRADAEVSASWGRENFATGSTDVPGNPKSYLRVFAGSAGNSLTEYRRVTQRIEDVTRFFGKTVTLSFYAKASTAANLSLEFAQNFGTGGSPTATITGIGVSAASKKALTTSWQKFTLTVAIPAAPAGVVLGTNGDSYLELNFWFSAGSNYNSRTQSLGTQTGTVDITQVKLEFGGVATTYIEADYTIELARCERFLPSVYESNRSGVNTTVLGSGYAISTTVARIFVPFRTQARIAPTSIAAVIAGSFPVVTNGTGTDVAGTNMALVSAGNSGAVISVTVASGLTIGQGSLAKMTAYNNGLMFKGCEL